MCIADMVRGAHEEPDRYNVRSFKFLNRRHESVVWLAPAQHEQAGRMSPKAQPG